MKALLLPALIAASASAATAPAANVANSGVTVSGISAGGFAAVQFHVAFSSQINGVVSPAGSCVLASVSNEGGERVMGSQRPRSHIELSRPN